MAIKKLQVYIFSIYWVYNWNLIHVPYKVTFFPYDELHTKIASSTSQGAVHLFNNNVIN
jgi:hypothetical protein